MNYRSCIWVEKWFVGFTIRRFSVFVSWKCDKTLQNYGKKVGLL